VEEEEEEELINNNKNDNTRIIIGLVITCEDKFGFDKILVGERGRGDGEEKLLPSFFKIYI